jgi:hypothetical protein
MAPHPGHPLIMLMPTLANSAPLIAPSTPGVTPRSFATSIQVFIATVILSPIILIGFFVV